MLEYRSQARWDEAAAIARRIVDLIDHPDTPAYQLQTMRLEMESFEHLASLPQELQDAGKQTILVEQQVHQRVAQGDYCGAVALAQEHVDLHRKVFHPRHYRVALSMGNLVVCLRQCGRIEEAYVALLEGLDLLRETVGDRHPNVGTNLQSLALILYERGAFTDAELKAREALSILQETLGPWHPLCADLLGLLGSVVAHRGDYIEANDNYLQALSITRSNQGAHSADYGTLLADYSQMLLLQGSVALADSLAMEAKTVLQQTLEQEHPDAIRAHSVLADIADGTGNLELAGELRSQSLRHKVSTLGAQHPSTAGAAYSLAMTYFTAGNLEEAEALLREARMVHQQVYGDLDWWAVHENLALGHLNLLRGRAPEAVSDLRAAAEAYEFSRSLGSSGTLMQGLLSPYATLAYAYLAVGEESAAFESADLHHGRLLQEHWASPVRTESAQTPLSQVTNLQEALRQALNHPENHEELSRLIRELNLAQAEWMNMRTEAISGNRVTLSQVESSLQEGEALVGWLEPLWGMQGNSQAYAIRPGRGISWTPVTYPDEQTMSLARRSLSTPGSAENQAALHMTQNLVHPVFQELARVTRVFVVQPEACLGIPIGALPGIEAGGLLGDTLEICYLPSAGTLVQLRRENSSESNSGRALLVGDPPFNSRHLAQMEREEQAFPETPTADFLSAGRGNAEALKAIRRLPHTRSEITSIAGLFPDADVLLGPDASEPKLLERIKSGRMEEYQVIHIASHAVLDEQQPDMSAIILSLVDTQPALCGMDRFDDGLIRARDIAREWSLSADLVVLSCCETGLGRTYQGQGHLGFSHAFLGAGAKSLLASLWPVDDRATSLFMEQFYHVWQNEGNGKISRSLALQHARAWLRKYDKGRYAHPHFWSGFVLIGVPD